MKRTDEVKHPRAEGMIAHVRGPDGMSFSVVPDSRGQFDKKLIAELRGPASRVPSKRDDGYWDGFSSATESE